MIKKNFIFMILMSLLAFSCSKKTETTSAKLKLSLSKIANFSSGIGSGGAILFGRSAQGELFGKVIAGTEENLSIPNGDWVFYALMWDSADTGKPMNDKVHCAKKAAKLSGTDVTLNLSLNNSNCADSEFSNGRIYTAMGLTRFSDVFLEECDDLNSSSWFCGLDNQGSALSYRVRFQEFKRGPGTPFAFGPNALISSCKTVDTSASGALMKALDINFPSGVGINPFVVSVEMFLGSTNCNPAEAKGMDTIILDQGLGQNSPRSKAVVSNLKCNFSTPDWVSEGQKKCQAYLGSWSGSTCSVIPTMISRFAPQSECTNALVSESTSIKQMVSVARPLLCDRYNGLSAIIGSHPFGGGDGTLQRPYKICNEWQINQIGEVYSGTTYQTSSFKLMNDLDMNKADFGPYAKPNCSTVASSLVTDTHHNLNPIGQLFDGNCTTVQSSTYSFQGIFNGNNKTIYNARIHAKNNYSIGMFRKLNSNSFIRNLNFVNLEVTGRNQVGGLVGETMPGSVVISNIKMKGVDVEAKMFSGAQGSDVGSVVGHLGAGSPMGEINNTIVEDSEVRGNSNVGGIVGNLDGKISKVRFSGEIDHHSDGDNIGGLVGTSSVLSVIDQSVSEGKIHSRSMYIGGIIGSSSSQITNSYSTMNIFSRANDTAPYVGGIVGYSDSGSITDVFFDGTTQHVGIGGQAEHGIKAGGSASMGNCYTSHPYFGGGCTDPNYGQFRNGTTTPISFGDNSKWVRTVGSIPRLLWEQRECLLTSNQDTMAAQIAAGRGSLMNPGVVCNSSQLKELENASSGQYYRLAEDINLKDWTTNTNLIESFAAILKGDNHTLYGADITIASSAGAVFGLFKTNNGVIKDVNIYSNRINGLAEDAGLGILAGENAGTIYNVKAFGNVIDGYDIVGGLVGINLPTGKINLVDVASSEVTGLYSVGGIVGRNDALGEITRASSRSKILNRSTPSDFHSYGGIVGTNSGKIDQARFGGEISMSVSSSVDLKAGGIAGNNSGNISNTYTDPYTELRVKNSQVIGGLIGLNTGSLVTSFALGKVIYDNIGSVATPGDYFHSLIGNDLGSRANTFWLENTTASILASNYMSTTFLTSPTRLLTTGTSTWADFSTPADAATLFRLTHGTGNDDLQVLTPITLTANDTFNYSGVSEPNGTGVNFYKGYVLADTSNEITALNFADVNTFCGGFSGPVGYEVCMTGYDIVYSDHVTPANNQGYERLVNYYVAQMNGQEVPVGAPVWEHSDDEDHPRLLQLLDN